MDAAEPSFYCPSDPDVLGTSRTPGIAPAIVSGSSNCSRNAKYGIDGAKHPVKVLHVESVDAGPSGTSQRRVPAAAAKIRIIALEHMGRTNGKHELTPLLPCP